MTTNKFSTRHQSITLKEPLGEKLIQILHITNEETETCSNYLALGSKQRWGDCEKHHGINSDELFGEENLHITTGKWCASLHFQ